MSMKKNVNQPETIENALFEAWLNAKEPEKEQLVVKLHHALFRHAIRVCWLELKEHRPDIANYCVFKALNKAGKFRGDAKFSTWFHRIVLNACTSGLRHKIRQNEKSLESLSASENAELATAVGVDAKLDLQTIMGRLSPGDRQFLEYKLEGLESSVIAKRTGLTQEGVRSKWQRIRKRIQALS